MSSKSNTGSVVTRVESTLSTFVPKRGIPTWKSVGLALADVTEYLGHVNVPDTMDQWVKREGGLGNLPASLLSDAIMSAIIAADDIETMADLKAAFVAAKSGQSQSSGDAMTDNATKAGDKVGQLIANMHAALTVLENLVPSQVRAAGQERVDAYLSARDAEYQFDQAVVTKLIGNVVSGNSTLAQTYGQETVWS